jgi:hypothetical protein
MVLKHSARCAQKLDDQYLRDSGISSDVAARIEHANTE